MIAHAFHLGIYIRNSCCLLGGVARHFIIVASPFELEISNARSREWKARKRGWNTFYVSTRSFEARGLRSRLRARFYGDFLVAPRNILSLKAGTRVSTEPWVPSERFKSSYARSQRVIRRGAVYADPRGTSRAKLRAILATDSTTVSR